MKAHRERFESAFEHVLERHRPALEGLADADLVTAGPWEHAVVEKGERSRNLRGDIVIRGARVRTSRLCRISTGCAWIEPFCRYCRKDYPIEAAVSVLMRAHGAGYMVVNGVMYLNDDRLVFESCEFS